MVSLQLGTSKPDVYIKLQVKRDDYCLEFQSGILYDLFSVNPIVTCLTSLYHSYHFKLTVAT